MILLNLGEPLSELAVDAVATIIGRAPREVIEHKALADPNSPYGDQARRIVDDLGMSSRQWQSSSLLVVLPSDPALGAIILSEIAGRRGRTPTILRMRPSPSGRPSGDPAEAINLHDIRREARESRDR